MLIIIAVTVIALAVTYLVTTKSHQPDSAQLSEPRTSLLTVGVQIICGDCCGDDERPRKTYLDRFGNCMDCGGHSYILASNRAVYGLQLRAARLAEYENELGNGRVLPFGTRTQRTEKIAV